MSRAFHEVKLLPSAASFAKICMFIHQALRIALSLEWHTWQSVSGGDRTAAA
jgi:hypothetical protein